MAKSAFFVANAAIFFFCFCLFLVPLSNAEEEGLEANSNLFREYIRGRGVTFSDVPINRNVQFHFIVAYATDYTRGGLPTNGRFNIFWNRTALTPAAVQAIKARHPNVRVAVSLGGRRVARTRVVFNPRSVSSWVNNSVTSLTRIIRRYRLDGIDINYQYFGPAGRPAVFADAIGQLISRLKRPRVISFASIATFDTVQSHYLALWRRHARHIDYVNFKFYKYPSNTTVQQFLRRFDRATRLYRGGRVLTSFGTANKTGGLKPPGFFIAARRLKRERRLEGIFVWNADASKRSPVGFLYERQAQRLLAARPLNSIFTDANDEGDVYADAEEEALFTDANGEGDVYADAEEEALFTDANGEGDVDAEEEAMFTYANDDGDVDAEEEAPFTDANDAGDVDADVEEEEEEDEEEVAIDVM